MQSLESSGFEVSENSRAAKQHKEWLLAHIGFSGKFQQKGKKAYLLCARPWAFKYMDEPDRKYSTNPYEYPYKFTVESFNSKLSYKSELLNFDPGTIDTAGDWNDLFKIASLKLPDALENLGVNGLLSQLEQLKDPGYVEKIWLGNI